MNNLLVPFLGGLLTVIVLFSLCSLLVIGIKAIYLYVKSFFVREPVKKQSRRKTQKQVKSIEIDPDSVDKIFVKKAS